ncbi:MAG: biopolymer transporter ExbD [Pseudomonadota bacterium]
MIVRRRKRNEEAPIDLTAMIDIVFILLIFFVAVASFVVVPGVEIARPTAATTSEPLSLAGRFVLDQRGEIVSEGEALALQEVPARVRGMIATTPKGTILIEADPSVPTGQLIGLVDVIREAGGDRLAVAARGEEAAR